MRRVNAKRRSLEAEARAILDAGQWDFADRSLAEPGEDDIADFLDSRRVPHKPVKL